MAMMMRLAVLTIVLSAAYGIMMPVRRPPQPVRHVQRYGGVPMFRVRNGPVKRIYVPYNINQQQKRLMPMPPKGYEPAPTHWKHKPQMKMYHPMPPPQQWNGPTRKARNPKPKYNRKPLYNKFPIKMAPAYDNHKPKPVYNPPVVSDSYGVPKKQKTYQQTAPTYGKPHPSGSPEPPKDKSTDDVPTSYLNVYQGEKATKEGKPTYSYTQSHSQTLYEEPHKSSPLATNHRPVYKPKSESDEDSKQGSFQPPKQTYGFTPYEEALKESSDYSPNYYKKQPDTVLSPNYFEQDKS